MENSNLLNMNKTILILTVLSFFFLNSCRKKDEVTVEEAAISTSDASTFREESDQALNEASNYTENTSFGKDNARSETGVDSVTVTAVDNNGGATTAVAYPAQRRLVINFENSESKDGQRTRNGKIVVQIDTTGNKPKKWNEKDSELLVTFDNLRITRKSDGKFIIFSGQHRVKNTTGGRAIFAFAFTGNGTVTHEISGAVDVTFEDGGKRTWTISRKREFAFQQITVSSTRADNIIEQGVNRFGSEFNTSINDPIVVKRITCNARTQARVTDGLLTHSVGNRSNSIEFGYNATGVKATTDCNKTSAKITYINRRNQPADLILTFYRNI